MDTVTVDGEFGSRGKDLRPLRVSLALVCVAVSLGLLVFANVTNARRAVIVSNQLAVLGDTGLSAAERSKRLDGITSILEIAPIDPEVLNQFVILERSLGVGSEETERAYVLLSRLGWRSTSAQQNLIGHALAQEDFASIVERSDGLMRRKKFVDEITTLLLTAEQSPAGRALVAESLKRRPPWAKDFIKSGGEIRTKVGLEAHAALLNDLLDEAVDLKRVEAVPPVRAMVREGLFGLGYEVFARMVPERARVNTGIFDPDFTVAAGVQSAREPSFPFEWNVATGRGISSRVEKAGDHGRLALKWDGKGNPLLFRQMFPLGGEPVKALEVKLSENNAHLLNSLQFFVSCAGEGEKRDILEPSLDSNFKVILRGQFPGSCEFVELQVYGLAEIGAPSLDLRIDQINLVR